jgi:hypothetical protein
MNADLGYDVKMSMFLNVLAVISLLMALGSCAMAKTVVHETYAAVLFLAFAVFAVGGAVLNKLNEMQKRFPWEQDSKPKS